jgi:hypothetical protein
LLVIDGIRRASLRNSYEKHEPLVAGEVYELEVDLWSTSLVFNTGAPHLIPGKTHIATNTICVSGKCASRIILPIYKVPGIISLKEKSPY